jgi:hypothetical protein
MLKFLRLTTATVLMGIAVFFIGWALLIMVWPTLFTSDPEELRLFHVATVDFLTTFRGMFELLTMLALPALAGLIGYFMFRPPKAFLLRFCGTWQRSTEAARLARSMKARTYKGAVGESRSRFGRGHVIALLGGLLLLHALTMDVSVESGYGRVVNIGKVSDKHTEVMVGCLMVLVGVVIARRRN